MTALVLDWRAAREPASVGGKAAALAALAHAGFDVPHFLVILPAAFAAGGLRREVECALAEQMALLGPGPFAVRSSGREEDGAAHSHAGQFLSVLDVPGEEVAKAAARVWQSGDADSLRAYRISRGLDPAGGAPAVIVQQMIRARAAGVAFSADPVSGCRDRIVISATAGLADRLVSGEADGFDYVVDRASGRIIASPAGGILSDADVAALAHLAGKVEDARGAPQDIEWAFEGARLFLLQARPITTTLRAAVIADRTVAIFDNSNIVESYPGLVAPLTFSFAQYVYARVYRTFVALLGVDAGTIRHNGALFENMLARIDGRVYYNLINWYRALALLPGFAINRAHMESMMGVGEPLPADISDTLGPRPAHGLAYAREVWRLVRVGVGLAREALRIKSTMRAFYARLETTLRTDPAQLDTMPLTALAAEYRRIESELLDRWDAPLINDFLCMVAFGASGKLMERWGGAAGIEIHNAVMIGQGDIVSAEPAQRIARMGALAAGDARLVASLAAGDRSVLTQHPPLAGEIASYIAKFGDRCPEELKLESITLADDPTPVFGAVAAAARKSAAPRPVRRNPHDAIFAGRPFRSFIARRALGLAKARVRDRENLRFERTRVFGRARRLFIAMGRQLHARDVIAHPRDVLFLTVDEVLGAIEGFATTADLAGLVAVRKAEQAAGAALPDPPERIRVEGALACRTPAAAARASGDRTRGDDVVRRGTGCSAGLVRASARVVRDPRAETLSPGDVMVARHTDPGWIALFANAGAIVVERGSLLSHSAIVARELGIPCVVGLKGATEWIRTGDQVEVDGGAGTVRLAND
jgi:pyruvate,water dikinase